MNTNPIRHAEYGFSLKPDKKNSGNSVAVLQDCNFGFTSRDTYLEFVEDFQRIRLETEKIIRCRKQAIRDQQRIRQTTGIWKDAHALNHARIAAGLLQQLRLASRIEAGRQYNLAKESYVPAPKMALTATV